MNELIKFLTSTEVVIVYIVAGALIALCLIIYAIDRGKKKRKKRHNTNELNKLVDKVQERLQEEKKQQEVVVAPIKVKEESVEPKYMEEIIPTPKSDVKEMTYNELKEDVEELEYYDRTEPNREEALSELARITKELEEQANEERMQSDIRRYEDEREKEAIISYDELLHKTGQVEVSDEVYAAISVNELNIKEEDPIKSELTEAIAKATGEEPVILQSIEETDISNLKEDVSITSTINNEIRKFKRSPIISPIYGIENNKIEKQMEFENTANYEKLDAEIKKTNEFLSTIKELQKKLGD